MERMILTEENHAKLQENLLLTDSKLVLEDIKTFTNDLKTIYFDDNKFNEILQVLHGRFSKLEINLIKLKKVTNGTV